MLFYNEFYLTLVRHGQSTTNQNPDLMGQEAETPLSDNGMNQAALLNQRLLKEGEVIDMAWASTYTRAHDTAKIALLNVPHGSLTLTSELREYDAGEWLGASRASTLTTDIKANMGLMAHGFLPPKGESLHQVERRASKWLEDNILYNEAVCEVAASRRDRQEAPLNLYLFSHGMTIKCLLHYIMGFDQAFAWKVMIENTSMSKLYFGKDGWKLFGINDHAHLKV